MRILIVLVILLALGISASAAPTKDAVAKKPSKKNDKLVKVKVAPVPMNPFEALLGSKTPINPRKSLAFPGNMRAKLVKAQKVFVYSKLPKFSAPKKAKKARKGKKLSKKNKKGSKKNKSKQQSLSPVAAPTEKEAKEKAGKLLKKKANTKKGAKGKKGKGKGKKGKKGKKAGKRPRPSVLVRKWVDVGKNVTAQRLHSKILFADKTTVHVLAPHRTTNPKVSVFDESFNRIRINAFLDIKGNVAFVKKQTKKDKKKKSKSKKGSKSKSGGAVADLKKKTGVDKLAHAPAFIEDLLVVSRHPSAVHPDRLQHLESHDYTHQWELVEQQDETMGWMYVSADNQHGSLPFSRAHADPQHQHLYCPLSPLSTSISNLHPRHPLPPLSFSPQLRTLNHVFTNLPPHTLLQVSATFHFIGHWKGDIGSCSINGQPVWMDTFHAFDDSFSSPAPSSLPTSPLEHHYSVPFTVVLPHSESMATVEFGTSLLVPNAAIHDMSCWGIDNVRVSVSQN